MMTTDFNGKPLVFKQFKAQNLYEVNIEHR